MRYRRADTAGGTYFFTVNLAERHSDLLTLHTQDFRAAASFTLWLENRYIKGFVFFEFKCYPQSYPR